MLGSARAEALSYSAMKLFLKYSNLCDHGTWMSQTDRRTDRQTTYCGITTLCVTLCGRKLKYNEHLPGKTCRIIIIIITHIST